jgi:YqxM protein
MIRSKRLRKFRNKHKYFVQLVRLYVIVLITFFTFSNLTGNTKAEFYDLDNLNLPISTGTWAIQNPIEDWDKSSLKLTSDLIFNCLDKSISITVKNAGDGNMAGTSTFTVYKLNGNERESIFGTGTIPKLDSGASVTLTYSPITEPGKYELQIHQRPGHGNDNNGQGDENGRKAKVDIGSQCFQTLSNDSSEKDTPPIKENPQQPVQEEPSETPTEPGTEIPEIQENEEPNQETEDNNDQQQGDQPPDETSSENIQESS